MVTWQNIPPKLKVEGEKLLEVPSAMTNSKFGRLFALGREINDTRSKIKVANDHLARELSTGLRTDGAEDLALAREVLRGDLEREMAEANELIPIVEELVYDFQEQIKSIENGKKVQQGLARIEEMRGEPGGAVGHRRAAGRDRVQILRLKNLIAALGDLKHDLTSRKEVISCPKCASYDMQYRITPSELGFSLYKCNRCSNAWRVRRYSMQIG